jgi:hypothetical protein
MARELETGYLAMIEERDEKIRELEKVIEVLTSSSKTPSSPS